MEERELVRLAAAARERAYAPYSGYAVGAALLADDGTAYVGCNVENASYGATLCAERVALGNAVVAGHRQFRALAVVTAGPRAAFPCGICRQSLAEFAPDLTVIAATVAGEHRRTTLAALLPEQFGAAHLAAASPSADPAPRVRDERRLPLTQDPGPDARRSPGS